MIILERLLTRSDAELHDFLLLVAENRNKDSRWEAFKTSDLKNALEVEYEINKTSFFVPGGLEALARKFVSKNRADRVFDVDSYREMVKQEISNLETLNGRVSRNVESGGASTGKTKKTDHEEDDRYEIGFIGNIVIFALVLFGFLSCSSVLEDAKDSSKDRVCNAYTGSCESKGSFERRMERNQKQYDDIIDSIN